jgi:TM2 domain-containing membrane protein YozV
MTKAFLVFLWRAITSSTKESSAGHTRKHKLKTMWDQGLLTSEACYWRHGMPEWANLSANLGKEIDSSATPTAPSESSKSRGIYVILGVLLGGTGAHNFYAGYYLIGAVQLVLAAVWLATQSNIILLALAGWIIADLCFTTKDQTGKPFKS